MPGKYTAHHPPLPNKPGTNWVEKQGGLPPEIDAVARALKAKGMATSRAVATAVNHVRKVCATGYAIGGKVKVSAEARAKACKAAARWEAMKAAAKADTSIPADERRMIELAFKRIEGEVLRIDMAKGDPPGDSPAFNWRIHGNRRRGVVLKNGRRAVVSPAQFDRLKAAKLIDTAKTPALKGDKPSDAVTKGKSSAPASAAPGKAATPAAKALKSSAPLVKHRITRGPRKGEVVEGRMVNGRFWEVRTNTDAKNPRKGRKFVAMKNAKGQKVHRYVKGGKVQDIVVK